MYLRVINQHCDNATRDISVNFLTRSVAERPFRLLTHTCAVLLFLFFVQAISRSLVRCTVHSRHSDCEKQRGRQCSGAGGGQREGLTGQTPHPLGRFLTFLHFPDHYREVSQRSAVLSRYIVRRRRRLADELKKENEWKRFIVGRGNKPTATATATRLRASAGGAAA